MYVNFLMKNFFKFRLTRTIYQNYSYGNSIESLSCKKA